MITDSSLLDDEALIRLAGKGAFTRGRTYHAAGRIRITRAGQSKLEAEALGSELYVLWIKVVGRDWQWGCSCPAAADGSFCKHLVGAALAWREGTNPRLEQTDREAEELCAWLIAQPPQRLAGWLMELAEADRDVGKRLRLYRAGDDPAQLKKSLGKLLNAGGFLDHRAGPRYAHKLDVAQGQLRDLLARDPTAACELCEYTLGRALKAYSNSDDSSGAIGSRLRELAELHAQACASAPGGKALARGLHALQSRDQWGFFPLADYWAALGEQGRDAYGRLVLAEFEALPKPTSRNDRYGESGAVRRRAEAYARAAGDFDLLQRVLRSDLSHPHDHLSVIESLREAGRGRESLQWAERAVKLFPSDFVLRRALATELCAAGLAEEAISHIWQMVRDRPDPTTWDALKEVSGEAWPLWRGRALDAAAKNETPGHASVRVALLLHDGDLRAATELAAVHPVNLEVMKRVAQQLESSEPGVAGTLWLRCARAVAGDVGYSGYEQLVGLLQRAARLAPREAWQPVVAELRAAHRLKKRLMTLMDAARL